jgi:hypothetical protein
MKSLPAIKIGKYSFEASAELDRDHVLMVMVKSGEESISRRLVHQGKHDHGEKQFEKDVSEFATVLANELAGKLRSKELAASFVKGKA